MITSTLARRTRKGSTLPASPQVGDIWTKTGASAGFYNCSAVGVWEGPYGVGAAAVWGTITGTLADQTDLQTALNAKLNLAGGTLTGHLLFTDNTLDIGASGATRPRTGYFGTSVVSPLFTGALNGTVGATTPAAASVTTLAASSTITQTVSTDVVGLKINPAGGQTANLMEVTSDGTNIRFRLDAAGRIGSRGARFGNGAESASLTFDQFEFGNNITIFGAAVASSLRAAANTVYGWNSTDDSPNGSANDTGLSRDSAGVVAVGTGAQGSAAGSLKATNGTFSGNINGLIFKGGTPGIAGNGTLNTNSKDSAGKVTTTATGASTIVLTFSSAFANAPACTATNETTANLMRATSTTTTLTLSGTIVSGDVISYQCIGY